ncbi:SusD/RagB family nutrient-binding outer membrane lipoprotein [uncultured Alistipes sp.]|uniref:SusD/RagB family nutrient-binding outer membrane lipoprotein n=1 Tax=uncultured Alistipes sp. TaxID=538949 RepID=UPI002667018D|nr:SusD/RagB family nutrient-binding outer membrane lipoprotein [uncultured Alistipes sp.]
MKKITTKTGRRLMAAALLVLTACTGDFEDINRNPNQVTEEQMEALNYKTGTKVRTLQSLVIPVQEHMYQFNESLTGGPFAGYIGATVDTWQTKFETYNPSADWRKWPFANVITETYTPYKGIVGGTDDEVAVAFARLLRVAIMQRVTDSYGPIPYSKLESNESVYVEYDSQEAVYTKMFEELDEAIETLGRNTTLSSDAWSRYDGVYYGNIAQWLKYANSLKLRMAMRLTEVKPDLARTKASEAIAGGVITANADNAAMHAAENRTTLIYNDWGDHRVGADILCYMTGYNDPRVEKMFLPNDVGNYVGIRIGIDVAGKATAMTKYSNLIVESTTPYLWFNAAEATFLRAEYELRWGSEATAQSLYEEAIRLSFEERGASGADAYVADGTSRPAAYTDPLGMYSAAAQSTITIAWAPGADNFEENLERIITQKWIAIFPLGVEAWSEHRRTGYPRLMPVVADKSGGGVDVAQGARRLPYPVEEYQQNNTNLQAAIQTLDAEQTNGNRTGDQMGTRVWWDCKPYNN